MAKVRVKCPACGAAYQLGEALLGSQLQCLRCRAEFIPPPRAREVSYFKAWLIFFLVSWLVPAAPLVLSVVLGRGEEMAAFFFPLTVLIASCLSFCWVMERLIVRKLAPHADIPIGLRVRYVTSWIVFLALLVVLAAGLRGLFTTILSRYMPPQSMSPMAALATAGIISLAVYALASGVCFHYAATRYIVPAALALGQGRGVPGLLPSFARLAGGVLAFFIVLGAVVYAGAFLFRGFGLVGRKTGSAEDESPLAVFAPSRTDLAEPEHELPATDEAKYVAFVQRIEQGIASGNGKCIDAYLDMDTLVKRIYRGTDLRKADREDIKNCIAGGIEEIGGFGPQLAVAVQAGGSYTLLRLRHDGKQAHALFRFLTDEGGVNYHDMLLNSHEDRVRIDDIYIFLAGEFLSDSLRRTIVALDSEFRRPWVQKMLKGGSTYTKHLPKLAEMYQEMYQAKNPDKVLRIYETLPPELKKLKPTLILRLSAAAAKNPDSPDYMQALSDLKKYYPQDPCLQLVLVDYHLIRKEYDEARACVALLQKATGGDAYLDVIVGNIYRVEGKHAEAKAAYEKAIAAEPTLENSYWALITLALEQKDWKAVSAGLTRAADALDIEFEDLAAFPEYAEYVKTDEYREWKARQQTPSPAASSPGAPGDK